MLGKAPAPGESSEASAEGITPSTREREICNRPSSCAMVRLAMALMGRPRLASAFFKVEKRNKKKVWCS